MNKKFTILSAIILFFAVGNLHAQSFFEKLNKSGVASELLDKVTGGTKITQSTMVGEWDFSGSAVEMTGGTTLESIAGSVATAQLESKLNEYYSKAGIIAGAFSFTFNSDSTFIAKVKGKTLNGFYNLNSETARVTMQFKAANAVKVASMSGDVKIAGSTMSMLFAADKLLEFVNTAASFTDNSTVKTLQSLLQKYDGLLLGFKLDK